MLILLKNLLIGYRDFNIIIKIPNTIFSDTIIKFLIRYNLIIRYEKLYNYFFIYLRYTNGIPVIRLIQIFKTKTYSSVKKLKIHNNFEFQNSNTFLSTTLGICTLFDAFRYRLGGQLLFQIFYN